MFGTRWSRGGQTASPSPVAVFALCSIRVHTCICAYVCAIYMISVHSISMYMYVYVHCGSALAQGLGTLIVVPFHFSIHTHQFCYKVGH